MRRILLLCGLLLALPAPAQDWKVDYARSWVRFTSKQMNVPMPGGFKRFAASARFDPARPEAGSYRVEVEVASIDTGTADGDDEVKRPAWFDAARHPKASFATREIRKTAQGYLAQGDMTVKGQTRPASLAFALKPLGTGWQADGRYVLKRSAFGIGGGEWSDPSIVADEVSVDFRLVLTP